MKAQKVNFKPFSGFQIELAMVKFNKSIFENELDASFRSIHLRS